jgi:hypothetical protein
MDSSKKQQANDPLLSLNGELDREPRNSFEIESPDDKHPLTLDKEQNNRNYEFAFSFRKLLQFMGPGFMMSMAYLDPGNIAGDLDAGRVGGYSLIWLLMVVTILGWFYQSMAVALGLVT